MSHCHLFEKAVDGELGEPAAVEFRTHLATCDACATRLTRWRSTEKLLGEWAQQSGLAVPQAASVQSLVARARRASVAQTPQPWYVAAFAAAAATMVVVFILSRATPEAPVAPASPLELVVVSGLGGESAPRVAVVGTVLDASRGRIEARLGTHRLTLAAGARARVINADPKRVRLVLEAGELGAIAHGRDGVLEVTVSLYTVRIAGARVVVRVEESRCEVSVLEGQAWVVDGQGRETSTAAGQRTGAESGLSASLTAAERDDLEQLFAPKAPAVEAPADDALDDAESPLDTEVDSVRPRRQRGPKGADLDRWRSLMVRDRPERVEAEMLSYLRRAPHDVDAWSLLADYRRRAKRWRDAVAAYRHVITGGDGVLANRARYLAASVLQDELGAHDEAGRLLRAFLKAGAIPALRWPATVRLANSTHALGDTSAARALLEEVISKVPGTADAKQAAHLLNLWKTE